MDEEYKKFINKLVKDGWNVQLDKNGKILFVSYWHPELIVSKISLNKE